MDTMTDRLQALDADALLGDTLDAGQLDAWRATPDIAQRLLATVNDAALPWLARFIASELLFRHVDMALHAQCDPGSLQDSYLQALRHSQNGVDWAYAGGPDALGPLGRRVAASGANNPAWQQALSDEQIVPMHFAWRLPPHHQPPYRVKDFAALVLAAAQGTTIQLAGPPAQRDAAIAALYPGRQL